MQVIRRRATRCTRQHPLRQPSPAQQRATRARRLHEVTHIGTAVSGFADESTFCNCDLNCQLDCAQPRIPHSVVSSAGADKGSTECVRIYDGKDKDSCIGDQEHTQAYPPGQVTAPSAQPRTIHLELPEGIEKILQRRISSTSEDLQRP